MDLVLPSISGMLFICLAVDKIGRKMVQMVAFAGSAMFFALLFFCTGRYVRPYEVSQPECTNIRRKVHLNPIH